MKIIEKRVGELTPYAQNTKRHDKKQIENVATSIKKYGFVFPEEGKTYIELSSCVKEFFDNCKSLVEADLLTG